MKKTTPGLLIQPLEHRHKDYLKDESRTSGRAESISFPENEIEVQAIVKPLLELKTPITVQGSRTGITGGAVPLGGHILNLSKMTKVTGLEMNMEGNFSIRVQPGISLSELDQQLYSCDFDSDGWGPIDHKALKAFKKAGRHFWPPDPSERSASIGGIAANNSRGISALYYGPACRHIKGIRMVDTRGDIHAITRGEYVFSKGSCPLPCGNQIRLDSIDLGLVDFQRESPDDPAALYDLMDIYLGSEGMFGVITELTLSLKPIPKELWGIVFFFETQSGAVDFIQTVSQKQKAKSDTDIAAVEFMDQTTLECIREYKEMNSRLKGIPDIDTRLTSAVYIEIHGNTSEEVEALSERLLKTAAEYGSDPDDTWAFCGETEMERLRLFRCAAPESVNLIIDRARLKDPRITKLGTDYSLENGSLSELLEMYHRDLNLHGLKGTVFGHAAQGHLHVNILPEDYGQFEKSRSIIEDWAKKIHAKGGSVVTEHGIGKIKKKLFTSTALPGHLEAIRRVKQQLDPHGLWNPGNMMDL